MQLYLINVKKKKNAIKVIEALQEMHHKTSLQNINPNYSNLPNVNKQATMILFSIINLIILAKFVLFNLLVFVYICIIHIHQAIYFPPNGFKRHPFY
jgi:hypothetical protein